jgi:hypothetical protein
VGQRKTDGRGEGDDGGETSMTPVMGDGNGEGETTGCGYFWRGRGEEARRLHSADGTMKSGAVAGEVESGGGWRSKTTERNWASGSNARFGRTADWADEKNITNCMRCNKKIGEGILAGQNRKEKRKIKTGKDFWLLET